MDDNLTILKWNIDQLNDTYYEVHLYRHLPRTKNIKLSHLKVVGSGNEIEKRTLTEYEIEKLFLAIEQISIKYDNGQIMEYKEPCDEYRLQVKSAGFNLDFKWTTEGIVGYDVLTVSLARVIEAMCDIRELDYPELGLQLKM